MRPLNFQQLLESLQTDSPKTVAVANAGDREVLRAVEAARRKGVANGILVGDQDSIREICGAEGIDPSHYSIVHTADKAEACALAVEQVRSGTAQLLMKGFVDTSILLRAVLHKEDGLKGEGLISHVSVFEAFGRLMLLSDSAMNVAPGLEQKVEIVRNMTRVAHALGIPRPKIAAVCAVEKVNEKMPATLDAAALAEKSERGELPGCIVCGPMALDNAVDEEAAKHKGVDNPVAGKADALLMPDIEAGNILIKSLEYFAKDNKAGVIMGAKVPIVLTSRASSDLAKLYSIALGVLVAKKEDEQ